MKKILNKEFAIGASVIAAIVILIAGIEYLKGINLFRPANYYMAYYDNVDELTVSSPVLIDGFKVGQVREVNFNYERPGKIEVVMALDKNFSCRREPLPPSEQRCSAVPASNFLSAKDPTCCLSAVR